MDLAIAALLGLAIGSFLNVCIARIPHRESVVSPGSHCPNCKHPIRWYDNVPVLAYLWLKGRCRDCAASISARYPLVETVSGLISISLVLKYGLSLEWAIYFLLCGAFIALSLIDLDHRILPDVITLNGVWIGVVLSLYLARPDHFSVRFVIRVYDILAPFTGIQVENSSILALSASLLGVLFGGGLLWIVREAFFQLKGIEGMGLGDVKMMAMVGAFLGVPLTLTTILIGSVLGSLVGIVVIRILGKARNYHLPFGTFLGAGAIVAVLYGNELLAWYLGRFAPPTP